MSYIRWQTVPEPRCCRSKCSVAKRALCATDDQCSSVGRTQSSDTVVLNMLYIVCCRLSWIGHKQVDTSTSAKALSVTSKLPYGKQCDPFLPTVDIRGCAFHWCQAVWQHAQELRLQIAYNAKDMFHAYCRQLLALLHQPWENQTSATCTGERSNHRRTVTAVCTFVRAYDSNPGALQMLFTYLLTYYHTRSRFGEMQSVESMQLIYRLTSLFGTILPKSFSGSTQLTWFHYIKLLRQQK